MRSRGMAVLGVTCAVALMVSACGNDDESSGGGGGGTLDIGVLTSSTGSSASTFSTTSEGVKARFAAYEDQGGTCAASVDFNVVEGDDTSTPQGALAGAQKLVEQQKVDALLEVTPFFFGATPWLTSQGASVPVFGGTWDGAPEWRNTDDNMFASQAVVRDDVNYSTLADLMTGRGVTKVAGISYDSPSAKGAVDVFQAASEAAGLQIGYINQTVPFGSTDVGAIVLRIIDSGADGVYFAMNPDTSFAIIEGLRQANYSTKALVLPTGYGNDLLQSPPAVAAGQGAIFQSFIAPVELHTGATDLMSQALIKAGVSDSGIPGYAQYQGWLVADLFLHSLEEAGCQASQADIISTMQQDTDWDAGGLYAQPVPQNTIDYDKQCTYFVTLEGQSFVPVDGAAPICGKQI